MMKPAILLGSTTERTVRNIRGKMRLREGTGLRMNVGSPTQRGDRSEGVGYVHSSEDIRKGKNGRSEGTLLKQGFQ